MTAGKENPIFITGADRSGSTLIARIVALCGVELGLTNTMFENKQLVDASRVYIRDHSKTNPFPTFDSLSLTWQTEVLKEMRQDRWAFKSSLLTQMWQNYDYAFPNAKWVIVRRKSADIVNSCIKTNYMSLFKSEENRQLIGAKTEAEAWLWWIHQYEEQWVQMITKGLNCKMIWPERMVTGDYGQIYEMLDWLGLEWDAKIPLTIDPLLNRNRRK